MITPTVIRSKVYGPQGKVQVAISVIGLTGTNGYMVDHTLLDENGNTRMIDQARWSTESGAVTDWEERCRVQEAPLPG